MEFMNSGKDNVVVHQSLCRMCDDHCGINVHVQDGRVMKIDGIKEHPWNRGRLCVKGSMGVDQINAPDRLLKPLKKKGNDWEEVPLETALDEIAEKITYIQKKYGKRAMSVWKGEALGFMTQEDLARRFVHCIGSPNYFSNDSQCMNGRLISYNLAMGTGPGKPEFAKSKCIVLWGTNPPCSHPCMTQEIMKGKKAGSKLIVIDSRRSAIARKADIFLQIKPGTDGAVAWGLAREIIKSGCMCREFIENYCVGFDEFASYAAGFTQEFVENETGLEPGRLIEAAKAMCKAAPRVASLVGNGLEHHENGVNNIRAVACLDALLGSLDVKGGNFIPENPNLRDLTLYKELPLRHLNPIGADKFPVLYDMRKECHTMMAMETILSDKPYPLRGMVITGANPALTNPNTEKVIRALKALDLLVVRDLWITETSSLADYILPAATYLERSEVHCHKDYQLIGLTPNIVSFPHCQNEYMFWRDLAHRLGAEKYFPWNSEDELNNWILADSGITREHLFAHPAGYQYKPKRYKKYRLTGLNTPSGKFEFTSEYLRNHDYEHLPEYISPRYISKRDPQYPLVMITGARKVAFSHGRFRNFVRTCTTLPSPDVELHPDDAKNLGIEDGDLVVVISPVGSFEISAKIMREKDILPGVIQITHGWKDANVNLITHDEINDPIDGFPLMKAVQVRVEKR